MCLPLLPLLRKQHPEIEITWVCGRIAAPLVKATALVDRLLLVDEHPLFKGSLWCKGGEVIRLWKQLFFASFDQVILAHPDFRFRLLTLLVRGKKRCRFAPTQQRPCTEQYLELLGEAPFGKAREEVFPELECTLSTHLEQYAALRPILIAPGGAKNLLREDSLRRWPIDSYVKVAEKLHSQGFAVAVVGASSDSWVSPHFAGVPVINLIGQTTLTDLVALMGSSRLLITHDSSPLHLAKLAKCKTIALFGPTSPRAFGGIGASLLWGGDSLACSPCYNGKGYPPCKNNVCMQKISVQDVLISVERALSTEETSIPLIQRLEEQTVSNPS